MGGYNKIIDELVEKHEKLYGKLSKKEKAMLLWGYAEGIKLITDQHLKRVLEED